jgi:electron transfer flavoprotein alpha/beta subunit
MKIVVCVKQVPDTAAERKLNPADSTLDRASVDGLINELDEYAIEEGLLIAEAQREAGLSLSHSRSYRRECARLADLPPVAKR